MQGGKKVLQRYEDRREIKNRRRRANPQMAPGGGPDHNQKKKKNGENRVYTNQRVGSRIPVGKRGAKGTIGSKGNGEKRRESRVAGQKSAKDWMGPIMRTIYSGPNCWVKKKGKTQKGIKRKIYEGTGG